MIPRFGTISTWSSKATDIARNCKIPVNRIERGIHFIVCGIVENDIKEIKKMFSKLYDPLTESLLFTLEDLTRLFQRSAPKTFNLIYLLENGKIALREANDHFGLALSDGDIHYLWILSEIESQSY